MTPEIIDVDAMEESPPAPRNVINLVSDEEEERSSSSSSQQANLRGKKGKVYRTERGTFVAEEDSSALYNARLDFLQTEQAVAVPVRKYGTTTEGRYFVETEDLEKRGFVQYQLAENAVKKEDFEALWKGVEAVVRQLHKGYHDLLNKKNWLIKMDQNNRPVRGPEGELILKLVEGGNPDPQFDDKATLLSRLAGFWRKKPANKPRWWPN